MVAERRKLIIESEIGEIIAKDEEMIEKLATDAKLWRLTEQILELIEAKNSTIGCLEEELDYKEWALSLTRG